MTYKDWDTQTAQHPTTRPAIAARLVLADWKAERDALKARVERYEVALRKLSTECNGIAAAALRHEEER